MRDQRYCRILFFLVNILPYLITVPLWGQKALLENAPFEQCLTGDSRNLEPSGYLGGQYRPRRKEIGIFMIADSLDTTSILGSMILGVAQTGGDSIQARRNSLKLDVFGPLSAAFYRYPNTKVRASIEWEHSLSKHVSCIMDAEWDLRQYLCYRLFIWPSNYLLAPEYWEAHATQNQVGLILGLRYSIGLSQRPQSLSAFAEGRVAGQYRHAILAPLSTSRPSLTVSNVAFIPRMRIGTKYMFSQAFGMEASLDLAPYRFIGNGRKILQPIVELNAVIQL